MEPNEHDIFSRLEHEIGRDLSHWRRSIIASFEKCYLAAYKIEESKTNEPLNLTDMEVCQEIRSHVISFLLDDWINLDNSPRQGDFVSVTGESFWHTLDDTTGELKTFKQPAGHKIQGTMAHWDILPYIDEAGLEEDAHKHPELIAKYLRPFGIHLVLDSPTLTDEHGAPTSVSPKRAYVPVHYTQADLKLYSARS